MSSSSDKKNRPTKKPQRLSPRDKTSSKEKLGLSLLAKSSPPPPKDKDKKPAAARLPGKDSKESVNVKPGSGTSLSQSASKVGPTVHAARVSVLPGVTAVACHIHVSSQQSALT